MGSLNRRAFPALAASPALAGDWPRFRGNGDSLAPDAELPLTWSRESNVAWRAELPGYGQSSPVVLGGKVFLTSTEGKHKETLSVVSLNAADGTVRWQRTLQPAQSIEDSDMVSKAAPTPVVDKDRVYAFFETGNLAAYNHGGDLLWQRALTEEYGEFSGRHGIGSSLNRTASGIVVLVAHDGPSYLLCVDPKTGKNLWKTPRPAGVSWSTPAVMRHDDRELIVVNGGDRVEAFAPEDGRRLWAREGLKSVFLPSPTSLPGGAVIGSGDKGHTLALRFPPGNTGAPEVLWRAAEASAYFNSPLVFDGKVYMVNKVNVAFCLDASTGAELWHQRLKGQCWASPIGASGRVYFFSVNGVTQVLRAGDSFEVLAENVLEGDGRVYGVAVSNRAFFIRYGRSLIRVEETSDRVASNSKPRVAAYR